MEAGLMRIILMLININEMEAGMMTNVGEMEAGVLKNVDEMKAMLMKKYCSNEQYGIDEKNIARSY